MKDCVAPHETVFLCVKTWLCVHAHSDVLVSVGAEDCLQDGVSVHVW